ncbi:MAG: VCBS repeat-containing protein [Planctomycetota bacterium]
MLTMGAVMVVHTRLSLLLASARSFVLLLACTAFAVHADNQGPWQRHTIDNSSKGADGVRLADANGDGLMDIVTGWEEGGIVRLYLNPGLVKSKEKWPDVTVGPAKNVEDAVMVDLDNDGAMDIVSSCEGKTKTMFVHWGPKDKSRLLDEDAWATEPIPATMGKQQWMYCLPVPNDDRSITHLLVGSKGENAELGHFFLPRENRRDFSKWVYYRYCDVGWIMSLEMAGGTNSNLLLVTDRKGKQRGVMSMCFQGGWDMKYFEHDQAEYMFGAMLPDAFSEGEFVVAVATRNGVVRLFKTDEVPSISTIPKPKVIDIPNPFGIKNGKAVAIGKIDNDGNADLVVSFNTQGQKDKPGVAWIKVIPDQDPKDWPAYDISGLEGKKFDRIELIDLDGDGDLDVLTCEEVDNLGVIWYENPYGKPELIKP